jgi:hypothetical protein
LDLVKNKAVSESRFKYFRTFKHAADLGESAALESDVHDSVGSCDVTATVRRE